MTRHAAALAFLLSVGAGCSMATRFRDPGPEPVERGVEALIVAHDGLDDRAPTSIEVLDRSGARRFDLMDVLPRGDGLELRRVELGSSFAYLSIPGVSPTEGSRAYYPRSTFPGQQDEPSVATQVIAWLRDPSRETDRFVGLDADGGLRFDIEVDGSWSAPVLSPRGRYLFLHGVGSRAAVVDTGTGSIVWSGEVGQALFTRDDGALVHTAPDDDGDVAVVDLPSGDRREVGRPEWQLPVEPSWWSPSLVAATSGGVIMTNEGEISLGRFLWLVDLEGRWTPLGRHEEHTEQSLAGFAEAGRVVVFSVRPTRDHPDPQPEAELLGLDLETRAPLRFPVGPGHYGGEQLFELGVDGVVTVTPLREATATELCMVPPAPAPWTAVIQSVSANGEALVVGYGWLMNRLPDPVSEGTFVIDRQGTITHAYPVGATTLALDGSLVAFDSPSDEGFRIGDIEGGGDHAFASRFLGFIYAEAD